MAGRSRSARRFVATCWISWWRTPAMRIGLPPVARDWGWPMSAGAWSPCTAFAPAWMWRTPRGCSGSCWRCQPHRRHRVRILIVDDEALARAYLVEQLASASDVEIAGEATNGFDAVKMAEELPCDLMLLDVQMPKLSGFEVMELLGARAPAVIFVTAHDEFAVQAFQIHAVDYLLKPVEPARLQQALQRARERLGDPASQRVAVNAQVAVAARPPGQWLERVVIREGTHVHVLGAHTLDFIEAQDDYLVFAAGAKRYRKQHTLAQLEAQLDPSRFVRIHRSFLINVERIARIEPYAKDSWQVFLSDGSHVPMSRSGYQRLRAVLD